MALELWMLRHGEAVPHESKLDDERELTPRGEAQAEAAGAALAALNVELAACYTSPKLRARDTARLACRHLGVVPEEVGSLADGFGRDDALELLHAHAEDPAARVLVVGHNPSFAQVVHDLTGARIEFEKGGIAVVTATRAEARLLALLRPRDLEALGRR